MTNITRDLGAFAASLKYEQIPENALNVIHTGFADCVGVMLAGRDEPPTRILTEVLAPPAGPSTLVFGSRTASATDAAWINGVAAHALDFDDVALKGHPSTVLVPAILAEAQAVGATGREMMVAYAVGYEVWAELARRDPDHYHTKGWHPTGILGAIGAAAACASLNKLNAEQCAMAISLGASQSAGIMANFGTMTKPFHAGRSAQSGVLAARLAKAGFTSSLDALEHPQGFLSAVSPGARFDVTSPCEAGKVWKLPLSKLSVKKYPLCFCTHRALDGMLDLVAQQSLKPDEIESINARTSLRNTKVLRNHNPQTGLEAKFSMEFAMASCVVAERAGLNELVDEFVQRQDIQSLMKKVTVEADETEHPDLPGYSPFDQVTIKLKNGQVIKSREVVAVRGGPDLPLSREHLWSKFEDCATVGQVDFSARSLFDALMSLETVAKVSDLPGLSSGKK
ncbi:MmgE/PrpD family protein [Zwartia sp.]|uniref:MmgE/PrpD family protein n=1 Tax=Zwartia sp. TaxID=2978004 RepID=UPI002719CAD4|nr:MmgE/PrpD family protein [Zwartia sp.]MDO9024046.1 MmgE/PrpD family protein [Zwartia sp.]